MDLEPETVIDISHESLMRIWERLKVWAGEEARSAQRYHRLLETTEEHLAGKTGLFAILNYSCLWTGEKPQSQMRYGPIAMGAILTK